MRPRYIIPHGLRHGSVARPSTKKIFSKEVAGMANSIWTTEEFTCSSCGMNYTATSEERQDKRSASFNCSVCGTEVHRWSGYRDFFNWQGERARSPVFGRKR
jgi:predicted RNA-binding Zn-ribbon protein involved in translation (DUF1610 family)